MGESKQSGLGMLNKYWHFEIQKKMFEVPHCIYQYCGPANSIYSVISQSCTIVNDAMTYHRIPHQAATCVPAVIKPPCVRTAVVCSRVAFDCAQNIGAHFQYNTRTPDLYCQIVLTSWLPSCITALIKSLSASSKPTGHACSVQWDRMQSVTRVHILHLIRMKTKLQIVFKYFKMN